MNYLFLFIGILSLTQVYADDQPILNRWLYDRCRKYSIESSTYDSVKTQFDDFVSYLKYTANLIPDGKNQLCNDERRVLNNSLALLSREVSNCLPREEKYLPRFMHNLFMEIFKFLCEKDGKNMRNFFSTLGADCRQRLSEQNFKDKTTVCFNKMFEPPNGVLKRGMLCDDLEVSRKCFTTAVEQSCPSDAGFNHLVKHFFEHVKRPCETSATAAQIHNVFLPIVISIVILIVGKVY